MRTLIAFNLWGALVLGPIFIVLGVWAIIFPDSLSGNLWMGGEPVVTFGQKIIWLMFSVISTFVGYYGLKRMKSTK